jgi:hypothetical protein
MAVDESGMKSVADAGALTYRAPWYHRVRARRAAAVTSAPHALRVGTVAEGGGTGGTGGVGGGGGAQRSLASNMASTNRDIVIVLFAAVSSPMNCSHTCYHRPPTCRALSFRMQEPSQRSSHSVRSSPHSALTDACTTNLPHDGAPGVHVNWPITRSRHGGAQGPFAHVGAADGANRRRRAAVHQRHADIHNVCHLRQARRVRTRLVSRRKCARRRHAVLAQACAPLPL